MTKSREKLCETCIHWSAGAAADATTITPSDPHSAIGACQLDPPELFMGATGEVMFLQPVTHATRTCSAWKGDDIRNLRNRSTDAPPPVLDGSPPSKVTNIRDGQKTGVSPCLR